MKIAVLFGSPRKGMNTAKMVESFAEGAKEAGHEVTVIDVTKKKVGGCLACEYCHTKGNGVCVQKDDMAEIDAALKGVEGIVLASPVYYFTLTAQLQAVIQRFYATNKYLNIKKSAMILSSGSPNVYAGSVGEFEGLNGYMGWKSVGIVTAHGDENGTPEKLAACRELAKQF